MKIVVLPAFSKINPTYTDPPRTSICKVCGEKKETWPYRYHSVLCCSKKDVFYDLCAECAILCGNDIRWEYSGGGKIKTLHGSACKGMTRKRVIGLIRRLLSAPKRGRAREVAREHAEEAFRARENRMMMQRFHRLVDQVAGEVK